MRAGYAALGSALQFEPDLHRHLKVAHVAVNDVAADLSDLDQSRLRRVSLAREIPLRTAFWMLSVDVPTTSVTLYVASPTTDLLPR
jgi:hypothetical protein